MPDREQEARLVVVGLDRPRGADDAFPITDIDDILPGLIEGRDRVYSAMGSNPEFDRHLMDWINVIRSKAHLGAQPPNEFVALDHLLHDMRLYKSAAEVKVMREAARISGDGHRREALGRRHGLVDREARLALERRHPVAAQHRHVTCPRAQSYWSPSQPLSWSRGT